MFILIIRTVILYFIALIVIRLMGKRQIGQLQPFEIVITVMISELATLPMQDNRIPLIHTTIPMIILLMLQVFTSFLQLKSETARKLLCGKPSILIEHGKINVAELRDQRLNINDLLEELRLKDYYNIEDVEYAILETSGQLSIISKTKLTTVTKEDLDIKSAQEKLPICLVLDGVVNYENLKLIKKDYNWLMNNLKTKSITTPSEVFIAILNSKGEFMHQLKERKNNKK